MKKFTLLILVIFFGFMNSLDVFSQNSSLANIDEFILNKMVQIHKPGLSACIIKGDSVVWSGSYGYAILEDSLPVSDTTLFTICSVSKPITASCILQLWEEGMLELDENTNNFLPFQVDNPYIDQDNITARMLMIHTSTILDYNPIAYFTIGDPTMTLGYCLENYLSPMGEFYDSLNFENTTPGTTYAYTTAGYGLLGYLAEPLTGMEFHNYAQDVLFNPLNMDRSTWLLSELNQANLAVGYNYSGGSYIPHPHYGIAVYPGATLRSNVFELANFVIMLMNGGIYKNTQILNASTVDSMTTLQAPVFNYGLGIQQTNLLNYHGTFTREIWGHNGASIEIAHSGTIGFCPDNNTGIIFLSNSRSLPIDIKKRLFDYAAMIVIAKPAIDTAQHEFTAVWQPAPDASGYFLDVAFDENFSEFVPGYENLDVGFDTSLAITDLTQSTTYCYRLSAYNEVDTGAYSNSILVTTLVVNLSEANQSNNSLDVLILPNPMRSNVCFEYELTEPSEVILEITDQQGQQIETLINGHQDKGRHKVSWNAGYLSEGVYFCRLKTSDKLITRKIIKCN